MSLKLARNIGFELFHYNYSKTGDDLPCLVLARSLATITAIERGVQCSQEVKSLGEWRHSDTLLLHGLQLHRIDGGSSLLAVVVVSSSSGEA